MAIGVRFHRLNAFEQPGFGITPLALDGALRKIEDVRNFRLGGMRVISDTP